MEDKSERNFATLFEQNKWIMKSLEKIEKDVEHLTLFKAKVIGAGMAAGVVGAFIVDIIKEIISK